MHSPRTSCRPHTGPGCSLSIIYHIPYANTFQHCSEIQVYIIMINDDDDPPSHFMIQPCQQVRPTAEGLTRWTAISGFASAQRSTDRARYAYPHSPPAKLVSDKFGDKTGYQTGDLPRITSWGRCTGSFYNRIDGILTKIPMRIIHVLSLYFNSYPELEDEQQ